MGTLKPQSNRPLYSNTMIGTLAVVFIECKGNYSATSNNVKSVHCSSSPISDQCTVYWSLMGELLHLVQREEAWASCGPAQSHHRCTKCNSSPISDQCTNFILFDVAL